MARKTYTSNYGTSMRRLVGAQKVKDLKIEIDDSDSDRILQVLALNPLRLSNLLQQMSRT